MGFFSKESPFLPKKVDSSSIYDKLEQSEKKEQERRDLSEMMKRLFEERVP